MDVVSAGVGEVEREKQLEGWLEEESEKDSSMPATSSGGVRGESLEKISVTATVRNFQSERAVGTMWEMLSICVHLCVECMCLCDCESIRWLSC